MYEEKGQEREERDEQWRGVMKERRVEESREKERIGDEGKEMGMDR